jgi:hypothetical protein
MSERASYIDASAAAPLPILLILESQQTPIFLDWLNFVTRKQWLVILKSINCRAFDVWLHSHSLMRWIMMRSIRFTQVLWNLSKAIEYLIMH